MTADRDNNFGILRLFLASLVIISHSPELVDGDRSREVLSRLFGTMSFGEVAVDGFFLISGYLITESFMRNESVSVYLRKRVLRIVPAYVVSFTLSVLVLVPLLCDDPTLSVPRLFALLPQVIALLQPYVPAEHSGLHYPLLNGAMWTIAYEFRCYLLTALLGSLGLFQCYRAIILVLAVGILLIMNATNVMQGIEFPGTVVLGKAVEGIHLTAMFGVGALYYLYRALVPLTGIGACLATVSLMILFRYPDLAETAYIILGGYSILWFAFKASIWPLRKLRTNVDISYGLYLYGWPIQTLIVWNDRIINPWLLSAETLVLASLMGWLSWIVVEKPSLNLVRTTAVG